MDVPNYLHFVFNFIYDKLLILNRFYCTNMLTNILVLVSSSTQVSS